METNEQCAMSLIEKLTIYKNRIREKEICIKAEDRHAEDVSSALRRLDKLVNKLPVSTKQYNYKGE